MVGGIQGPWEWFHSRTWKKEEMKTRPASEGWNQSTGGQNRVVQSHVGRMNLEWSLRWCMSLGLIRKQKPSKFCTRREGLSFRDWKQGCWKGWRSTEGKLMLPKKSKCGKALPALGWTGQGSAGPE